ncbi:MAG: first ORF in transposon ISC1904 [Metallosphaera javensis (ex Sakai et al. 2022)]|nr:MAG: first ORF in transposon ISC1904 [Metallosphaera javensis (ex Sakai et al. 2022)]
MYINYNTMLRPKEVCQRLGISYRTLQEYVKKGIITPVRLPSGKMRFREEDVEKLEGIIRKKKIVLYARVSSNTQKDDLVNQVNYLKEKVPEHHYNRHRIWAEYEKKRIPKTT